MQNISYPKQRISTKAFHKLTSQSCFCNLSRLQESKLGGKRGQNYFLWDKRKDSSISRCLTALSSVEEDIVTAVLMILGFRFTSKSCFIWHQKNELFYHHEDAKDLVSAQISNNANKTAIENKKITVVSLGFICGLSASKQTAVWRKRTNSVFMFRIRA